MATEALEKTWITACDAAELAPGAPRVVRTPDGARIALFRRDDGAIRALDDVCPHEGYPLSRGEIDGETLTCCWHNFRFDMRSGACLKGDEAVRVFPTRERDGRVEIDVTQPDPRVARAARWESLEAGVLERRPGQIARDLERLGALGVEDEAMVRWVVAFDTERAEWGSTHVLPVARDVLGWRPRHAGDDAALLRALPFELAADTHVRRPRRDLEAPEDPGPSADAAGAELRARVEVGDAAGAEALLRGAIARGFGADTIAVWLDAITGDHFLDIGHHLIYQVKAFELLEIVGWEAADAILPGHLAAIVHGTRHDTLPAWRWLRRRLDAAAPRFATLFARGLDGRRDRDAREAIARALGGTDRGAAADAPLAALADGVALDSVFEGLVLGAAERICRFDVAHDADPTLQDGWLDVTHAFTYASALRQLGRRRPSPALLRHALYAARYVQALTALDGPEPVHAARPLGAPRAAVEARILHRPWGRPIVVAHLVKVATAAYLEAEAIDDPRPLEALGRLLTAPLRQRSWPRLVHEARRLVHEGKVPRTRL